MHAWLPAGRPVVHACCRLQPYWHERTTAWLVETAHVRFKKSEAHNGGAQLVHGDFVEQHGLKAAHFRETLLQLIEQNACMVRGVIRCVGDVRIPLVARRHLVARCQGSSRPATTGLLNRSLAEMHNGDQWYAPASAHNVKGVHDACEAALPNMCAVCCVTMDSTFAKQDRLQDVA